MGKIVYWESQDFNSDVSKGETIDTISPMVNIRSGGRTPMTLVCEVRGEDVGHFVIPTSSIDPTLNTRYEEQLKVNKINDQIAKLREEIRGLEQKRSNL